MSNPNKDEVDDSLWQKDASGLFLPKTIVTEQAKATTIKKKTFKDYMAWVFNNISIALLIPSFFGATWQILELSSMNLAYIRFFSITQIPFDGILILFLIILLYIIGKGMIGFTKHSYKEKMERFKDKDLLEATMENINRSIIKSVFINILLICSMIYMIVSIFAESFPKSPIAVILFFGFNITGLMFYLVDTVVLLDLKLVRTADATDNESVSLLDLLKKYKYYVLSTFLAGLALIIFYIYSLITAFSASFTLPVNLYNTRYLDSIIYNEFKTKEYKVEYFNDKYIFVELCAIEECDHQLDKEIVIYPTEKALFKTTYGKVWTGYFTTHEPVNN